MYNVLELLRECLTAFAEFLISPLGQMTCWGTLTFSTFMYTVIKPLDTNTLNSEAMVRSVVAAIMTVFWVINNIMWFASSIWWMAFTDTVFFLLAYLMYRTLQYRWLGDLTQLYGICIFLDLFFCYFKPEFWVFSNLVNLVYLVQLYVVSGCRTPRI